MMSPRVSVVMPVHNGARFLEESIESVLAQTFSQFELVVVDDGSTDSTWEILQRFEAQDERVRPLRNSVRGGIVAARNRAFDEAAADSEFFAILDADDACLPERLALQVEFLERNPGHALVGGNLLIIDDESRPLGRRTYPATDHDIRRVMTRYNPIAQPTTMLRRSSLERVGRYDARFPVCEDYDLWFRIAEHYLLANLPVPTLKYRLSEGQTKQRHLRDSLRQSLKIQRQWLFHPSFFRASNTLAWIAQHGLLALPPAFTLALFQRIAYRRSS